MTAAACRSSMLVTLVLLVGAGCAGAPEQAERRDERPEAWRRCCEARPGFERLQLHPPGGGAPASSVMGSVGAELFQLRGIRTVPVEGAELTLAYDPAALRHAPLHGPEPDADRLESGRMLDVVRELLRARFPGHGVVLVDDSWSRPHGHGARPDVPSDW